MVIITSKQDKLVMMDENYIVEVQALLEGQFNLDTAGGEEWMQILASRINDLVQNDFGKLIGILYRLDVDELKVGKVLKEHSGQDAGELIAGLIVERQLAKIRSRQEFGGGTAPIDEDEKW